MNSGQDKSLQDKFPSNQSLTNKKSRSCHSQVNTLGPLDMKHIEIFNLEVSIELLSQKSMVYDKPLQSF